MTRYLILAAALAACTGKSNRSDSADVALPAIDTLKPVTASDTSVIASDTLREQSKARTQTPSPTRLGRDSAFSPPANLPRLDTVKKKPTR